MNHLNGYPLLGFIICSRKQRQRLAGGQTSFINNLLFMKKDESFINF